MASSSSIARESVVDSSDRLTSIMLLHHQLTTSPAACCCTTTTCLLLLLYCYWCCCCSVADHDKIMRCANWIDRIKPRMNKCGSSVVELVLIRSDSRDKNCNCVPEQQILKQLDDELNTTKTATPLCTSQNNSHHLNIHPFSPAGIWEHFDASWPTCGSYNTVLYSKDIARQLILS